LAFREELGRIFQQLLEHMPNLGLVHGELFAPLQPVLIGLAKLRGFDGITLFQPLRKHAQEDWTPPLRDSGPIIHLAESSAWLAEKFGSERRRNSAAPFGPSLTATSWLVVSISTRWPRSQTGAPVSS
jgi:hypothetical protein